MLFHSYTESPYSFDVDHERFEREVVQASCELPILVDFWAEWCAPCHQLTPHLNRIVDEFQGTIRLAKVEVDAGENMKLAGFFRLRGFPTVILFRNGRECGRFSGSRSSHQVREWLEAHLGDDEAADCEAA
jgi:putative thioredoxin